MNEAYEYTIDKKSEGVYRFLRLLMLLLYVAFIGGFFGVVYYIRIIPVFALAPIFLWILIYFTWRYVKIEYKYSVDAGYLSLMVIYGGKTKKTKATFHIKDATAFLPLSEAEEALKDFKPKKTYNFLSSHKNPSDAYAFMINSKGKRTLALIEAPKPSVKAILYYADASLKNK